MLMLKARLRALDLALRGRGVPDVETRFPEASPGDLAVMRQVKPYTMTSKERVWAVINAARYVVRRGIPGDFVECGVWRGGSTMAAALTFLGEDDTDRTLWLYDTYEGMSAPTAEDRKTGSSEPAELQFRKTQTGADRAAWCDASIEDVQANLALTGYPSERLRFVKGKVEDTLPEVAPQNVALLRLDTDWYASTKVELETLWDRLSPGGVLILDDYGSWEGARLAVDEFFAARPPVLLNRIDETCRLIVKA
jgi:hypothetical protein